MVSAESGEPEKKLVVVRSLKMGSVSDEDIS
jgi:hypothetical protein